LQYFAEFSRFSAKILFNCEVIVILPFIIFILKSIVFPAIWLVHRSAISARIALLAVRFVPKLHLLSTNHIRWLVSANQSHLIIGFNQPIYFEGRLQSLLRMRGLCLRFLFWSTLIAVERNEAAHYSWRAMVSPESTRPSLSRDLCLVEISILCLSVGISHFRGNN
jgi:hypothetical protein